MYRRAVRSVQFLMPSASVFIKADAIDAKYECRIIQIISVFVCVRVVQVRWNRVRVFVCFTVCHPIYLLNYYSPTNMQWTVHRFGLKVSNSVEEITNLFRCCPSKKTDHFFGLFTFSFSLPIAYWKEIFTKIARTWRKRTKQGTIDKPLFIQTTFKVWPFTFSWYETNKIMAMIDMWKETTEICWAGWGVCVCVYASRVMWYGAAIICQKDMWYVLDQKKWECCGWPCSVGKKSHYLYVSCSVCFAGAKLMCVLLRIVSNSFSSRRQWQHIWSCPCSSLRFHFPIPLAKIISQSVEASIDVCVCVCGGY